MSETAMSEAEKRQKVKDLIGIKVSTEITSMEMEELAMYYKVVEPFLAPATKLTAAEKKVAKKLAGALAKARTYKSVIAFANGEGGSKGKPKAAKPKEDGKAKAAPAKEAPKDSPDDSDDSDDPDDSDDKKAAAVAKKAAAVAKTAEAAAKTAEAAAKETEAAAKKAKQAEAAAAKERAQADKARAAAEKQASKERAQAAKLQSEVAKKQEKEELTAERERQRKEKQEEAKESSAKKHANLVASFNDIAMTAKKKRHDNQALRETVSRPDCLRWSVEELADMDSKRINLAIEELRHHNNIFQKAAKEKAAHQGKESGLEDVMKERQSSADSRFQSIAGFNMDTPEKLYAAAAVLSDSRKQYAAEGFALFAKQSGMWKALCKPDTPDVVEVCTLCVEHGLWSPVYINSDGTTRFSHLASTAANELIKTALSQADASKCKEHLDAMAPKKANKDKMYMTLTTNILQSSDTKSLLPHLFTELCKSPEHYKVEPRLFVLKDGCMAMGDTGITLSEPGSLPKPEHNVSIKHFMNTTLSVCRLALDGGEMPREMTMADKAVTQIIGHSTKGNDKMLDTLLNMIAVARSQGSDYKGKLVVMLAGVVNIGKSTALKMIESLFTYPADGTKLMSNAQCLLTGSEQDKRYEGERVAMSQFPVGVLSDMDSVKVDHEKVMRATEGVSTPSRSNVTSGMITPCLVISASNIDKIPHYMPKSAKDKTYVYTGFRGELTNLPIAPGAGMCMKPYDLPFRECADENESFSSFDDESRNFLIVDRSNQGLFEPQFHMMKGCVAPCSPL